MPIDSTKQFQKVHFIGIGGAGMSGIALVLHQRGYTVSGSDLKSSRYTRPLVRAGIDVKLGHDANTIDRVKPDVVVISSAIPQNNPELVRARELGIEVWQRAKMLSYLSQGATTVAIAGTHGKTTTSSLVATMLDKLGQSPTFLIGGIIDGYETNGHNGSGPYFVAEADESDGSFLYLDPNCVIVTNIEADHLDHYGSLEKIEEAFCELMKLTPADTGLVIVCGENPHLPELARSTGRRVLTYGFDQSNDTVVACEEGGVNRFSVTLPDMTTVRASLDHNPGRHNALNASAVITLGQALGFDPQQCADAVSSFAGVHRRFEKVGQVDDITVIDDYGHHPTEIASTLAAARGFGSNRVHVVFQPHRYSRTQALADKFGPAFADADTVTVMDVFSAGEVPIPGISGKTIASSIERANPGKPVYYVPNRHDLVKHLLGLVKPGDMLITMGAGDVTMVGPSYLDALRTRTAVQ